MKRNSVVTIVFSLVICATVLALTGCGSKAITVKETYTDADSFFAETWPFMPFGGEEPSYAFNMMGITEVNVEVTFDGEEYTYVLNDIGNPDPEQGMYWNRKITFTGKLSESDGTYTLSAPTSVTEELAYGTMFADYKDVWGEQGTFTEADDTGKALMAGFTACTATVTDDNVTFSID